MNGCVYEIMKGQTECTRSEQLLHDLLDHLIYIQVQNQMFLNVWSKFDKLLTDFINEYNIATFPSLSNLRIHIKHKMQHLAEAKVMIKPK